MGVPGFMACREAVVDIGIDIGIGIDIDIDTDTDFARLVDCFWIVWRMCLQFILDWIRALVKNYWIYSICWFSILVACLMCLIVEGGRLLIVCKRVGWK